MEASSKYLFGERVLLGLDVAWGQVHFDIFISAFNESVRVRSVFDQVQADGKFWVALPEYGFSDAELPANGEVIRCKSVEEAVFMREIENFIGRDRLSGGSVCVDITGFMRHQVVFLIKYLKHLGLESFYAVYAEPSRYGRREDTVFSKGDVDVVRQVAGYEGAHDPSNTADDHLVIGVGYDHNPIARTLGSKDRAKVITMHSLPSLSADMYQECMIRLRKVGIAGGVIDDVDQLYASANDPFVVASVLSQRITPLMLSGHISNLYLAPLATKPQALGFALFYIKELEGMPASIILPINKSYARETGSGVGNVWRYKIQL